MVDDTRRKLLKLLGATGVATTVGGTGIAAAQYPDGPDVERAADRLEDGIETARVRVGHLSPDAPAIDVYAFVPGFRAIGEVPVIENLRFPSVRPNIPAEYADIPAVGLGFRVTPHGNADETLFEITDLDPQGGRNYTLLVVGEASPELSQPGLRTLSLVDNRSEQPPGYGRTMLPAADEVTLRVVHAETELGAMDIEVAGKSRGSVEFGEATTYLRVDPEAPVGLSGDRRSGSGPGLDATVEGLEAGRAYTLYAVERDPEAGGFKPQVIATIDAVARPSLDIEQ